MQRASFNEGWTFKVSEAEGAAERSEAVVLPHDAMLSAKRTPDAPSGSAGAFFLGGTYIYEKTFVAPDEWRDMVVLLQFEGIYRNSTVLINGREAGGAAYGYTPFFVDAEGFLEYGTTNTVRVVADNSKEPNSRWYSGGGIYRPVWLWIGPKEHIAPYGVKVSTISCDSPQILVEVEHTGGEVAVEIVDGESVVANGKGDSVELNLDEARLWSAEDPYLYTCKVTLSKNGSVIDTAEERFGIRLIAWNDQGLFINGSNVLLRGGCIHSDNGLLGACSYPESEERRIRILKDAGFNAIRSAHNPASDSLLDVCDRLGMYVMDETWDMWYKHKTAFDYATEFPAHHVDDLRALIKQDYNHPSVIMYSIGNEVSEPATARGLELEHELVDYAHSLDPTRPVTAGLNLTIITRSANGKDIYDETTGERNDSSDAMNGMNSTLFNLIASFVGSGMNKAANGKKADRATTPAIDALDIAGYNYASGRYPLEGKAHPGRIIVGSETFPQDIFKNWAMVERYPYLVGDFMWTAWDYLGEVGIGAWSYTKDGKGFDKPYPWLLADTGVFDILGNPNGELFLARAAWGLDQNPMIAVQPANHPHTHPAKSVWRGTNSIPSWGWSGCEGNKATVEVYSSAHRVKLCLNGRSLGCKRVRDGSVTFRVRYEPGTLVAIAYDHNDRIVGKSKLEGAEGETSVSIRAEVDEAEPGQIVYFDITLVGENGQWESNADEKLHAEVTGGELIGFGSANPRTDESYISSDATTYYGKAQAIVRAGDSDNVVLTISADICGAAEAVLPVVPAKNGPRPDPLRQG